jgi:hypothetical protein
LKFIRDRHFARPRNHRSGLPNWRQSIAPLPHCLRSISSAVLRTPCESPRTNARSHSPGQRLPRSILHLRLAERTACIFTFASTFLLKTGLRTHPATGDRAKQIQVALHRLLLISRFFFKFKKYAFHRLRRRFVRVATQHPPEQ